MELQGLPSPQAVPWSTVAIRDSNVSLFTGDDGTSGPSPKERCPRGLLPSAHLSVQARQGSESMTIYLDVQPRELRESDGSWLIGRKRKRLRAPRQGVC